MAISAAIKFVQGGNVGTAGVALIGTLGTLVTASNGNDTDVTRWRWTVVDVPPGSTVPVGLASDGSTPIFQWTPDVRGDYHLELIVFDASGAQKKDRRVFRVLLASGRALPAFDAEAAAMNFSGNTRGWAPDMETWLSFLDGLIGGAGTPGGPTGRVQYKFDATTFGGMANVGHSGGDLCVGLNLGVQASTGAIRSSDTATRWLARTAIGTPRDLGVVEVDNDSTETWVTIGGYGDYASTKLVDEVWFTAKKLVLFWMEDGTALEVFKAGTGGSAAYGAILPGSANLVLGGSDSLTDLTDFGGGTRVILWRAGTAPTTDPASGSIICFVEDDAIKVRRSDGTVTPMDAPAFNMPALDVDWSKSDIQYKDLAAGANAITFSNLRSGVMVLRLKSDAGTSTVDFSGVSPTIKWPGGTVPTQSPTGTDVYTFVYDGVDLVGNVMQDFQ